MIDYIKEGIQTRMLLNGINSSSLMVKAPSSGCLRLIYSTIFGKTRQSTYSHHLG